MFDIYTNNKNDTHDDSVLPIELKAQSTTMTEQPPNMTRY